MPQTVAELRREWAEEVREEARGAHFLRTQNAHRSYGAQLRALAKQIARIIEHFAPDDPDAAWEPGDTLRLERAMGDYARAIEPWVRRTTWRMLQEVARRDKAAWDKYTAGMAKELRREIATTPIGDTLEALLDEQVRLITSLPLEAARRVHEKSLNALNTAARYPEREGAIQEALAEAHPDATQRWLVNRARLIARTETARSASVLTQARAMHIGAESYIWKTAGDWKVRPSHKRLNGRTFTWAEPPLSDPPDHHSHPGQIFNCRCVALPIIPE